MDKQFLLHGYFRKTTWLKTLRAQSPREPFAGITVSKNCNPPSVRHLGRVLEELVWFGDETDGLVELVTQLKTIIKRKKKKVPRGGIYRQATAYIVTMYSIVSDCHTVAGVARTAGVVLNVQVPTASDGRRQTLPARRVGDPNSVSRGRGCPGQGSPTPDLRGCSPSEPPQGAWPDASFLRVFLSLLEPNRPQARKQDLRSSST